MNNKNTYDLILIDENTLTVESQTLVETDSINSSEDQNNNQVWGESGNIIFDGQEINFTDFISKSAMDITFRV